MERPSILVILEPQAPAQPCLPRAAVLARYLGARLDVLYPAQTHRGDSPLQAGEILAEEWDYLAALRRSIAGTDIEMSAGFANGPLAEAIADKIRSNRYAFVVKAPWRLHPERSDPMDWQLIASCSLPLLLTHGKPWQPRPKFLAALEGFDSLPEGRRAVAETAAALQVACAAELHLVSVRPQGASPTGTPNSEQARGLSVLPEHMHSLQGEPAAALRAFVAHQSFDVLVVGATSRRHLAPPVWGRPQGLAQSLTGIACDLLSVPAPLGPHASAFSGSPDSLWSAGRFGHWLGVD